MKDLGNGLHLLMREELIDDQAGWDYGDNSKNFDYTTSKYWLVTDCGLEPQGFDTEKALMQYLTEL